LRVSATSATAKARACDAWKETMDIRWCYGNSQLEQCDTNTNMTQSYYIWWKDN
jgi:hypothetical protein